MRLAHFESKEYVTPIVSGLQNPTKAFTVGADGVEWIDMNATGTLVIVRRKRLPDLVFTAMGHGKYEADSEPVPGNRSGNPKDEWRGKK